MKFVNMILCALMILFMVAQFNDPDGPMWVVIYSVPAIWAGLAAFRMRSVLGNNAAILLSISILSMLGLMAFYWPRTEGFWQKDVWWETETAREGMGMMIATVVTLIAAWSIWSARQRIDS